MSKNIPKAFIDSLLEKANIVNIIANYIELKKKGNDYWARCPFHNEKTSSFSVSENKQFFHCFGCGAHGNAIGFLMDHLNQPYPEAIETLANNLGLEIPRDKNTDKLYETRKNIQEILSEAKKDYIEQLKKSPEAISYLKMRKITGDTAKNFQLGYAENNFQSLKKKLIKKYLESDLLNSGLIVKKENNSYDKFRGRIMFPIHDSHGNIIAFGGRIISINSEKPEAKYINSPETILFSKKKTLYNLHFANKDRSTKNNLYIVEGYMDVISLFQAGIKNAVATLGTAVSQENLAQCFKYTKEIICCFDGDKAGVNAAWRCVENIIPIIKDGDAISFVFLPQGNDPDNIIEKGGSKLWEEKIKNKISIEEFIFRKFSKECDLNTASGKTQFLQNINFLLEKLNARILKTMLLESLNKKIGSKYIIKKKNFSPLTKIKKFKTSSILHKAISILMHNPKIKIDENLINDNRIKDNTGIHVLKSIINLIKVKPDINIGRIIENYRTEIIIYDSLQKISTLPVTVYDYPDSEFHACICLFIKNLLKEKMSNAEPSDLESVRSIINEIKELEEKSKKY